MNKDYLLQRIQIFAGFEINPLDDKQVSDLLMNKFEIMLPQRRTLDESLAASSSEHDIVSLILQYRQKS